MKQLIAGLSLILIFAATAIAGGFAVSIDSTTTASVTTTSALLVPADPYRNYLLIQNNGSDIIIVKAVSAQSGSEGIKIPAGGSYEPIKGIIDAIYAKSASGTQSVTVVSGR